jgi:thiol-disulfide isomerase/thioredoxin
MRVAWFSIPILGMAVTALALGAIPIGQQTRSVEAAPEFTHQAAEDWLNSGPLTLESLRGQVVLIDFWTFDCWNCYRSFPWLNEVHERLARRGLQVIGVHSPEFRHEHEPQRVAAKVREFKLKHPVMIDSDFSYWKALNNQYWPAFYLIDKRGQVRYRFAGETHRGDARAREIESRIRDLIGEQP